MLFYVDRVELFRRKVKRSLPVIKGWNAKFLREREVLEIETGGFGMGFCVGPMDFEQCVGNLQTEEKEAGNGCILHIESTGEDNSE
ncbi:unnamed protein product, partial [Cuscuta epithymum]